MKRCVKYRRFNKACVPNRASAGPLAWVVLAMLLGGCQVAQSPPPPPREQVMAYIDWLSQGESAQDDKPADEPHWHQKQRQNRLLVRYYFMPLGPDKIEGIQAQLHRLRQRISQQGQPPQLKALRSNGRWAVAVLAWEAAAASPGENELKNPHGEAHSGEITPVWFFYYRGLWRVIAPPLYNSKEVRALMNLYPQNQSLNRWLQSQLADRVN